VRQGEKNGTNATLAGHWPVFSGALCVEHVFCRPGANGYAATRPTGNTIDQAGTEIAPTPEKSAISQLETDELKTSQVSENPSREITVETPFYTVSLSARGACFNSYILKNYRETVDADSPTNN
jgi:YidC/Oxa1 family membrane protein insertase